MFELVDEEAQTRWRVSSRAVTLGRAPANDIVLPDDSVSGRHASVWADNTGFTVQDHNSRNGTFVNETRVRGTMVVSPGEILRLGEHTRFRVEAVAAVAAPNGLALEDVVSGIKTSLPSTRFRLGDVANADLRVSGAPEVMLFVDGPEALYLGIDGDILPITLDEPFEVGARRFAVRLLPDDHMATRDAGIPLYSYRLAVTLENGPGARAVLTDPVTGATHIITAENRATVLWILAKRRLAESAAGDAAGWMDESEVLTSVWGRAVGGTSQNLRVLMCRIRKELKDDGFDPWFLEHRAGHLRVLLDDIEAT